MITEAVARGGADYRAIAVDIELHYAGLGRMFRGIAPSTGSLLVFLPPARLFPRLGFPVQCVMNLGGFSFALHKAQEDGAALLITVGTNVMVELGLVDRATAAWALKTRPLVGSGAG